MTIKTIDSDLLTNEMLDAFARNVVDQLGVDGINRKQAIHILVAVLDVAPAVEPAIQVKPLEWVTCGNELHAVKKNYKVRKVHDRHSLYFRGNLFGRYASEEQAKEAAQQDHNSKTLSNIFIAAKPAPVECEPVGYALTDLFGQPRIEDDELTVKTYSFACSDKTDCKPVYLHPPKDIDAETRRMVINLCNQIREQVHTWSLVDDAETILERLRAE